VVLRVPEPRRDLRHPLRTRLAWAGFGSLGGGLWISPHVEREAELEGTATEDSAAELLSFGTELGTAGDPQRLAAEAWDLTEVVAAYDAFITDLAVCAPRRPRLSSVPRRPGSRLAAVPVPESRSPGGPGAERVAPKARPRRLREWHVAWHQTAQDYFISLEGVSRAAA
jgi:phenylacetic acid degradation operon negative regulatory protein